MGRNYILKPSRKIARIEETKFLGREVPYVFNTMD